jgi:radical SAM protein with 4Fe4S-binding SPASM domain
MFTLSQVNKEEIFDVIKLCDNLKVDFFTFDRLVPGGNAKELKGNLLTPNEYKELLLQIDCLYKNIKNSGTSTLYIFKDNLYNIIGNNTEYLETPHNSYIQKIKRNCLIGKDGFAILSDGTVLACRRLPIKIGKLPDEKILHIFQNSKVLNFLKDFSSIDSCNNCQMEEKCYGCRAVAYAYSSGDYNSADPQCFIGKQ